MKRTLALEKLDEAVGDQMTNLFRVFVSNQAARDGMAADKFSSLFNATVKAYDDATKIINDKLVE